MLSPSLVVLILLVIFWSPAAVYSEYKRKGKEAMTRFIVIEKNTTWWGAKIWT